MKIVDCLFITPPGSLWIRFADGEIRKATATEERLFLTEMATVPEFHRKPQTPQNGLALVI